MYRNDSISFLINGHYSPQIWLSRGVKQGIGYNLKTKNIAETNYNKFILGCNLSPLLFSLFIGNLGHELNSTGLGIDLCTGTNISAIFFADDIVVIGKDSDALDILMRTARKFFAHHHLSISDTKSKVMSFDSSTGKTIFDGSSLPPLTLDQVVSFKYLGVPLGCSPYSLFKHFNEQVRKRAHFYLARVLSLVKSGPDRSELAYSLWTQVALPSILYGAEAVPLNDTTIKEVEKCQAKIGKFILQIPPSSANVCANIDAGLKPVWAVVAERVLIFAQKIMTSQSSFWPKLAMNETMSLGLKSPYFRYLLKWKHVTDSFDLHPAQIRKSVHRAAVIDTVSKQKLVSSSTFAMSFPGSSPTSRWFRPAPWVSDSSLSQIISCFRSCNSGIGNRGPAKNGVQYKLCPLCLKIGVRALNNEVK